MEELRATLSVVKEGATLEETRTFDPSGSSAQHETSSAGDSLERASSWHGFALTEDTELTESSRHPLSTAESNLAQQRIEDDLGALSVRAREGADDFSEAEKLGFLEEMFPTVKGFDRAFTLRKVGGNFDKAVEELLNQAFLAGEGAGDKLSQSNRGIEGFAQVESSQTRRGRKANRKRQQQRRRTSSTPVMEDQGSVVSSVRSRWDQAKGDVDFLAERTHLPRKTISSIYHESGAFLPSTIIALCAHPDSVACNSFLSSTPHDLLEAHASELAMDFPTLSRSHAEGLVRMTHPSTASAHELAKAMLLPSRSSTSSIAIVPQYMPRPPSPPSANATTSSKLPLPVDTATNLATARSKAFSQASSAYRKSKSKPLMGGAAAYYSSVGRDAAAALVQHEAAVADALVAAQSRPDEIDLHGVNVKDAVRITRTKVQAWWDDGATEWARHGKVQGHGGFRVVTGVGRHSSGGKSRLGPAVGAMLVREGWKVEVGDGVVMVKGRVRK